ncbi:MAG: helix-turn-helix domain-containing protein [Terriglobia bacterium]
MESFLCPKETAELLGVSARTAQQLMKDGAVPAFRVGRKLWRTTRQALDGYALEELARYRESVTPAGGGR